MQSISSLALSDLQLIPATQPGEHEAAIKAIRKYLDQYQKNVDKVYFISSIEAYGFQDKLNFNLLSESIAMKANTTLISIGCVSFYAALLDFMDSHYRRAILVFIEGTSGNLQTIINNLGFSANSGQSLESQEGYAVCLLNKDCHKPSLDTYFIKNVAILARNQGKLSMISTTKKLLNYLNFINTDDNIFISFENNTFWAKNLINFISKANHSNNKLMPQYWLPSIEENSKHFHSLKPLFEIIRYKIDLYSGKNLVILTLGSRGRIGILELSKSFAPFQVHSSLTKIIIDPLHEVGHPFCDTMNNLYSLDKNYEFIDNLFFEWSSSVLTASSIYEKCL